MTLLFSRNAGEGPDQNSQAAWEFQMTCFGPLHRASLLGYAGGGEKEEESRGEEEGGQEAMASGEGNGVHGTSSTGEKEPAEPNREA